MLTIVQALKSQKILPSLESEALLIYVLQQPRSYLYTWPEKELTLHQEQKYLQLIDKRLSGVPIAYLTNEREFYSRSFFVNENTLIPRHETELLIDTIIDLHDTNHFKNCLELGTGTGIIAITLYLEITDLNIIASDISEKALNVCHKNLSTYKAKIKTYCSDWFSKLPANKYDIIVSNPPYIETENPHLNIGDLRFEPNSALVSGLDGLCDIEHIIKESRHYLNTKGVLILEHGYNQSSKIQLLFTKYGYKTITTIKDYSNNDRVTFAYI